MVAGKPKTPEGDTAEASRPKACEEGRGGERDAEMCTPEERYSPWNSGVWAGGEGWGEGGAVDFSCIGVLIPTLNYPLSWAQLGPLVKTPPLFVLRNR